MSRSLLAAALAAALFSAPAAASWPLARDAGASAYADPANWPNDPHYANQWYLFGFTPAALAPRLSPAEALLGVGAAFDRAFSFEVGSPAQVIAIIGPGARLDDRALRRQWALNRRELPEPVRAGDGGTPSDPFDRNGDGRFDVADYEGDARVGDRNANGYLDPQDLIAAFADGTDDDGNGLVDDICGWDFVWNDNDPSEEAVTSDLWGTRFAKWAAAPANDDTEGVGACPGCSLLPLRASTHDQAPPTRLAAALRHAVQSRASVAALAATPWAPHPALEAATAEAADARVLVVGRSTLGLRGALAVGAVGPSTPVGQATTFLDLQRCGPSEPEVGLVAPTDGCGYASVALAAGAAALAMSSARGFATQPTPGELARLLEATALPLPGRDPATSVRRLNAALAVSVAEPSLPPEVELVEPKAWATVRSGEALRVVGRLSARAPCRVEVSAAWGSSPESSSYVPIAAFDTGGSFFGALATIDPSSLPAQPVQLGRTLFPYALTVSVRAVPQLGDGGTGLASVVRRQVFAPPPDPRWLPGFPLRFEGAGALSPRWADLDLDGSDELVVVAGPYVHALGAQAQELPGFPASLDTGAAVSVSAPFAVANVVGDDRPEIAIVSDDGALHLIDASGAPVSPFPLALPRAPCWRATPTGCQRAGVTTDAGQEWRQEPDTGASSAVVVTATPTGPLLLVASHDGLLHGYRLDGTAWPGFPLALADPLGGPLGGKTAHRRAPLTATPATADLDGDGWPEIAATSSEQYDDGARGYLFALGPNGPTLAPGWPIRLPMTSSASAPDENRPKRASPIIADFDRRGGAELVFQGPGKPPGIYDPNGQLLLEVDGPFSGSADTHPSAADLDGDGLLELINLDIPRGEPARLRAWPVGRRLVSRHPEDPLPLTMDHTLDEAANGNDLPVADLDGDGRPEVLAGAMGALHALNGQVAAAESWPTFTGARARTAAVGVARGELVVATTTASGELLAWRAAGFARDIAWDGFHHDPANTGFEGTPLPRRSVSNIGVPNPNIRPPGCCASGGGAVEPLLIALALGWLAARRRTTRFQAPLEDP